MIIIIGIRFIDYRLMYKIRVEKLQVCTYLLCFIFVVHRPIKVYSRFTVSFASCITVLSEHYMMHSYKCCFLFLSLKSAIFNSIFIL